jgi:hypothetical protein
MLLPDMTAIDSMNNGQIANSPTLTSKQLIPIIPNAAYNKQTHINLASNVTVYPQ